MLESAKFEIDSIEETVSFTGYHNPKEDWNGWSIPYFDHTECLKILKALLSPEESFEYNDGKFIVNYIEDKIIYVPIILDTDQGKKELWSIGGYEWTWSKST